MGVDDEVELPAVVVAAQLGVADGMVVARLPRHQPAVVRPATVDEVEPAVLVDGVVAVEAPGDIEKILDGGDVVVVELLLDLDLGHT